ncbi:hypothetical protein KL930_004386 [Ogataea haglerorum]|uniref:Major facilitator superfamily (MFS) profile domain-containing protein n=1 Tax=Ogataea haglerorum TaxID=1937702 RepID=A0AAN6D2W3_9ASCO|nr:hypothetical protein KL951_005335 [Ogataea haglerorum]KAG7693037.1 hypothetical protein KL915_004493 [Ogataea haglerorum]KAG7704363.1 hypothetical protein KL914_004350 [Ogataea haglerorum]KAG7704549.1 hypothetical protein KL950_004356 [Ogataea haglerorum]KAG7715831.1 hypothetical protein KL913_003644 [Ogataea haglerorum]
MSFEDKESPIEVDVQSLDEPIDIKAEKKLIHKFDYRLVPFFCVSYFFSSLDRSNIGNAKVAGMATDLNMTDAQFSNIASVLYATYIPFMVPGVWFMRRFARPKYYLGTMIIAWSLVTIFTIFVKSYGAMIVVRLLIGLCEGSYLSCMSVIATDYYFPHELARRSAYYFVASSFSGSFGGLIATGITAIKSGKLESWKYLYLIEGLLSLAAGIWVFIFFPDSPHVLTVTETEKKIQADRDRRKAVYMGDTKFSKPELWSALDWRLAVSIVIQFCQDICLYGFSTFLPVILKSGLGFNKMEAQYLTVPIYFLAGGLYLVQAEISDRLRKRGPVLMFGTSIAIIGYIILLAVKSSAVKYFACYLICFTLYLGTGLNEIWLASNTAPAFKRGTSISLNLSLGNVAGAVSPQVYRDAPDYTLGHAFTLGCLVVCLFAVALQSWGYKQKNKLHQEILESGVDNRTKSRKHGDDDPSFKFLT